MANELPVRERKDLQDLVNLAAVVLRRRLGARVTNLTPARCRQLLARGRRYGVLPQESVVEALMTVSLG